MMECIELTTAPIPSPAIDLRPLASDSEGHAIPPSEIASHANDVYWGMRRGNIEAPVFVCGLGEFMIGIVNEAAKQPPRTAMEVIRELPLKTVWQLQYICQEAGTAGNGKFERIRSTAEQLLNYIPRFEG